MIEIKAPKKLIEVALPLDDINVAAAREKSIRHGHPSTLHLWWARRPLAAARAVLFAQLVNDPGYEQGAGFKRGVNKEKAAKERERLFEIIRELVKWENINSETVLKKAREEILKSWRETCAINKDHPQAKKLFNPEKLPAFHDPFAGGGAIPLEAQRLGLESYASDLNPVAVIINKAMIEIPPKFAGRPPVGPVPHEEGADFLHEQWTGARGLAEDVRRYGIWMREEAYKRIGQLYPQAEITKEMAKDCPELKPDIGKKFNVIAWIWARTVKSPNPAYSHVEVPLVTTFILSSKEGKEAWVDPVVKDGQYRFVVRTGKMPKGAGSGTKLARGANFRCILSNSPIEQRHIRDEFKAKRAGCRLMAIVAEGQNGRIYLSPTEDQEKIARKANPEWWPEIEMNQDSKDLLSGRGYGIKYWYELFTPRQLVALTTFSDLVQEAIVKCRKDALVSGMSDDNIGLDAGGVNAAAYAEAIGVYLAFAVDYAANYWSSITTPAEGFIRGTFARQALPMTWDFAEAPPFGGTSGNWLAGIDWSVRVIATLVSSSKGMANQADAMTQKISADKVISTDPPYYDNISYADLSDFFYIWLRRSLKSIFPNIFSTLTVPKLEELVAASYRHGGKKKAEMFFLDGMTQAMHRLAEQAHPAFPITIYYAFKQSETESDEGTTNTGWETFLDAVIRAGLSLNGTWPMRTEREARSTGIGTNALASSIILVCRKRSVDALTISRREFLRELNVILPEALVDMTCGGEHSPVAPVDLSQAIIGPGMAVFSKYSAVLEADGKPMTVRTALQLINRFLAEDDFDHDTQFCLHWFETVGWSEGRYGEAEVLTKAKGTSVDGLKEAGVIASGEGKVRLLKWSEYPTDWNPENDIRMPVWEALHHLVRALHAGGETAAGIIVGKLGPRIEAVRQLAYRLYTLCERKGWAEDARAYNELIATWDAIEAMVPNKSGKQMELF